MMSARPQSGNLAKRTTKTEPLATYTFARIQGRSPGLRPLGRQFRFVPTASMGREFCWRTPLSIGQQVCAMRRCFAQLKPIVHRNSVTWTGSILSHEGGLPYLVKIRYDLGRTPKTWIISPPLPADGDRVIPHLYSDGSLCLHLPAGWNPNQIIAITIVPWICHWLFHYEIWLATNSWEGGGEHPRRRRRGASK